MDGAAMENVKARTPNIRNNLFIQYSPFAA